ncbi:hypothetical protein D3C81_1241080 [compost metagenome]
MCLSCFGYITHGDFVISFEKIVEALRRISHLLGIGQNRNRSLVANDPISILILGPIGNLVPVRGFIGLCNAFIYCNRSESHSYITNICSGLILLGIEFSDLFSTRHICICVFQAVFRLNVIPGILPVGPRVGHAYTNNRAFPLSTFLQLIDTDWCTCIRCSICGRSLCLTASGQHGTGEDHSS